MTVDADLATLRRSIREVLDDKCTGDVVRADGPRERAETERRFWALAGELGWLAIAVSEDHDGLGLGILGGHALQLELGAKLAPGSFAPTLALCGLLATASGSALAGDLLPRVASGELAVAACATAEAEGQVANGDGRFSGTIDHVFGPRHASAAVVRLRREGAPAATCLIAIEGPEATFAPCDGWDGTSTIGTLRCDGAPFAVLCEDDHAYWFHLAALLASDSVGGATEILDKTVAFMNAREQFGRPISTFQALKHRVADSRMSLQHAMNLSEHAAECLQSSSPFAAIWAMLAKATATDAYAAIAADCLQLHGAVGFSAAFDNHLYLKRSRLNQAMVWTNNRARDHVAREFARVAGSNRSIAEIAQ